MNVDGIDTGSALVVTVTGRLDTGAAPEFDRACDAWLGEGRTNLVVDMSGLEYISSMGLRSMITLATKLRSAGGRLALCGLGGSVREVFRISGLLAMFSVFDTREAALGNVG